MSSQEFMESWGAEPGSAEQPWYLGYTRPRMEQPALFHLERQGFEVYLPLFKTCRSSAAAGLQATFEPLFPRYILLRPASERQSLCAVSSTRGVASLVRFGAEPAHLSQDTVQEIRDFERSRNQAGLEAISPIQPGTRVRMRQGGLKALEGLVVSVARQRVTLLLQLLGREKQVTVGHAELELA